MRFFGATYFIFLQLLFSVRFQHERSHLRGNYSPFSNFTYVVLLFSSSHRCCGRSLLASSTHGKSYPTHCTPHSDSSSLFSSLSIPLNSLSSSSFAIPHIVQF
ncbi:hypothetical protein PMAYCL1PPCAC_15807 [Pristionchus mayeri]|uniref:Secreted protein n=1 Tax=Pristionchus mayeri TaxID=1317129 RepID=A0AAN5HYJ0_9BILA|nr:hypothetical protein PMAYCL1PPCAC_15807 [Pristionchus mayeri]